MLVKKEIKNLPTSITEKEREDYNLELLQKLELRDSLEEEKKLEAERFKSKIMETDGAIGATRIILRSGKHYRDIPCEIMFNEKDLTEEVFRLDTGERVSARALSASEVQFYSQQHLIAETPPEDPQTEDNEATDTQTGQAEESADQSAPTEIKTINRNKPKASVTEYGADGQKIKPKKK